MPIVKKHKDNNKNPINTFIFYDFETRQEKDDGCGNKIHEVNLCVTQQVCDVCNNNFNSATLCEACGGGVTKVFEHDPMKSFLDFVLLSRPNIKSVICIAHNSKGFDCHFVLKALIDRKVYPKLILNGTGIMLMTINEKIKFIDSLNFFHMKLSALPKVFGFENEVKKGTFPHLFNKKENEDYKGPLPDQKYFSPDTMSESEREKFLAWHKELRDSNYKFNFRNEIIQYCIDDVTILRRACIAFRQNFLKIGNVDPFSEACTIASSCNKLYRKNFLKEDSIGIIPPGGYRKKNKYSKEALEWLLWLERENNIIIHHAGRGPEYRINENILVDGYYQAPNGSRYIYQYHGCYWHGCPKCYFVMRNDILFPYRDTFEIRYKKTLETSERIKKAGYILTEMWSCEFKKIKLENPNIRQFTYLHPLLLEDSLNPRDAFYGGRTENTVVYREVVGDEKINYIDICSLYPFINKTGKFPIGHPKIYVGDECLELVGTDFNIASVEGLIKCRVLPPQNLLHPVLPTRLHKKLMFPLCRTCCENLSNDECSHENIKDRELIGTWVSDEVKKAVSVGYKILNISEIWEYKVAKYNSLFKEGGLFAQYINLFLKIKQSASGWPSDCNSDSDRQRYINNYYEREGIKLEPSEIEYNPGLRFLAKLCLNSFWGKFGQRENMGTVEIFTDQASFNEIYYSKEKDIKGVVSANEEVFYISWCYKDDFIKAQSTTNVVIAAYTTALARLHLYSYLEKLGDRVLYYDTDSCIYVTSKARGEKDIETGNFLGDMTDELSEYGQGSYIREFVSCGPKFYSYIIVKPDKSEKIVKKIKGITLNFLTEEIFSHKQIKDLALGNLEKINHVYTAIRRTPLHDVVTKIENKMTKVNCLKRKYPSVRESYPYGFKKMRACVPNDNDKSEIGDDELL